MSEIATYLDRRDLQRLALVSREWNRSCTPLLYRRVVSRAPKKVTQRRRNLPSLHIGCYTTTFEVHPHTAHWEWCGDTVPLTNTGRVRTLIVHRDDEVHGHQVDEHGNSVQCGVYVCPKCPHKHIEPVRCVVRPTYTLFDLKSAPRIIRAPVTACDTIVYIGRIPNPLKYVPPTCESCDPVSLAHPTQNLTFVALPFFWDHGPITANAVAFRQTKGGNSYDKALVTAIGYHIAHRPDVRITVVGLEDANPLSPGNHWHGRESRRQEVEKQFYTAVDQVLSTSCATKHWEEEERVQRLEQLQLATFYDYLSESKDLDEFEWQLVGRWLNMYDARVKNPGRKR